MGKGSGLSGGSSLKPGLQEGMGQAFNIPGRIQQHVWESHNFLLRVMNDLKPERTVELGTWKGWNAVLLSLVTSKITVSVDVHDYDRGESIDYIRSNGLNARLPLGDCRCPEAVVLIKEWLDGPIDLLFIDDGHCIEEVTEDHRIWAPLVRPGGWIVFHDINPEANLIAPGVHPAICQAHAYWATLTGNKEEIIFQGDPPGPGIGILKV